MKIQVRKCPFTGKIFEHDIKYRNHLVTVRNEQQIRRRIKQVLAQEAEFFDQAANTHCTNVDIEKWIIANWDFLYTRGINCGGYRIKGVKPVIPKLVQCELRLSSLGLVSNSHSAPKNGQTNWGKIYPDRPTSYLGFHGRLFIEFEHNSKVAVDVSPSDMFKHSIFHTSTGGGGGGSFGYDVVLWANDWPAMATWSAIK